MLTESWGHRSRLVAPPSEAHTDARLMRLALQVGAQGRPAPNPHVGAVVARQGRVVSVGYHERAGRAHAEVMALQRAGALARGAVLYVTLEPCNHHGRTPPCVAAILAAGVARVVIGTPDPNPWVAGGGARALEEAGLIVEYSTESAAARALIAEFIASLAGGNSDASHSVSACVTPQPCTKVSS